MKPKQAFAAEGYAVACPLIRLVFLSNRHFLDQFGRIIDMDGRHNSAHCCNEHEEAAEHAALYK